MKHVVLAALMLASSQSFAAPEATLKEAPRSVLLTPPIVYASKHVVGPDPLPVKFAFRLEPTPEHDSGWVFRSGLEGPKFISDKSNTVRISLRAFLKADPSLQELIDHPVGTAWERDSASDPWQEVQFDPDGI